MYHCVVVAVCSVIGVIVAVVTSIMTDVVVVDLSTVVGMCDLIACCRKAAQLYKEAGRSSAAAEALSKAAKLIEDKNPQVCVSGAKD